jgi:UDP-glucose 4-epimerase
MKILITGGNGFIARNLSEQLKGEYEILCPNRQELDLLDYSAVLKYIKNNKFDVIIHTATYDAAPKHSIKDPAKVLENNLRMFFNITRCKDYFGKMIFFGSGAEYSREHWISKMKEDYFDSHIPEDQYGLSKYIMTKYALATKNIYNLRLFAVFGKYEDYQVRLISSVCTNAMLNKTISIEQNKYYDFMYVDDLVKIVKWFIDNNPKCNVYNICTGNTISFKTIAEKVLKISGKKLDIEFKNEGVGKEYSGDNTLLMSELRDFEFTPIEDSLKFLYGWYLQNKEEIFKDIKK